MVGNFIRNQFGIKASPPRYVLRIETPSDGNEDNDEQGACRHHLAALIGREPDRTDLAIVRPTPLLEWNFNSRREAMAKKEWVVRNGDNYTAEIVEPPNPVRDFLRGFTTRINAIALPFGYLALFGIAAAAFYHGDGDRRPLGLTNVPYVMLTDVANGTVVPAPKCGLGIPDIYVSPLTLPGRATSLEDDTVQSFDAGAFRKVAATPVQGGWTVAFDAQTSERLAGIIGVLTYCRASASR